MSPTLLHFLLIIGVADEAADSPQPEPIDPATWFRSEDYPPRALGNDAEGRAEFKVSVGIDGMPGDCKITASTGNIDLDTSTCNIVRQRARFRPALNAIGQPVRSIYNGSVTWVVPDKETKGHIATIIKFEGAEAVPQCHVVSEPASLAQVSDQCAKMLGDPRLSELAVKYRSVVFLTSHYAESETPYSGEPGWGTRLSRAIVETHWLNGLPVACKKLVAEGDVMGKDPCTVFPDSRTLTEAESAEASTLRMESSLFGIPRE